MGKTARTLHFVMAQLNPTVGAVVDNGVQLRDVRAAHPQADAIIASELFLAGYPPEDLVLKRSFLAHIADIASQLTALTAQGGPALVFGLPWVDNGQLYNSVMVAEGGQNAVRHKHHLPNYAVFDEKRLFTIGPLPNPVDLCGLRVGLPVCEDIWFADVAAHLKAQGAELLISPNGSPFERGKHEQRQKHAMARVSETGLPLIYVNQFGGQDELVFDGGSFALRADGTCVLQQPTWCEAQAVVELQTGDTGVELADETRGMRLPSGKASEHEAIYKSIYTAAVIGLRDYVEKNRFPGVLLGLSGGIDSAICAAMAVDALGADHVHCIMLPSRYTSQSSLDDAATCANALGIRLDEVAITCAVDAVEASLKPLFAGTNADITEENIQSRLRGTLLMAISNKFGAMVVTTGNKSEVSVGYATLYGDMNGGYNPIKDIYKTEIFALARWRNMNRPNMALGPTGEVIPQAIIDKPPSAELRPDQKDEDSLPPYDQLDDILFALVEDECGVDEIIARGHDSEIVKRIEHLLYVSEYKRRQAAPGTRIGNRNFGRDRRYPITNGFRDARALDWHQ